MRDRANREEYERWVSESLFSCLTAELEHLWAKSHPEDWARSSQAVGRSVVEGPPRSLRKQDLLVLAEEYLRKREDTQLRERRIQFWLGARDGALTVARGLSGDTGSEQLTATGFGFTLPPSAIVHGVQVTMRQQSPIRRPLGPVGTCVDGGGGEWPVVRRGAGGAVRDGVRE